MEDVGGGDRLDGFGIVSTDRGASSGSLYGASDAGMVAHRGTLHPDEYVDYFVLREQVEADFGYAYKDVAFAYAKGRPSTEQRQLREKIDSRLLALSRAGGNMEQLAKALGLSEKTIDRALARAREIDVKPMVAHGVVKTKHVCFVCSEPAEARKRRFNESYIDAKFRGERPTIALCDKHYAGGFVRKTGNPAYWEFRERRR